MYLNSYTDLGSVFAMIGAFIIDPETLEKYILAYFEIVPGSYFQQQLQQVSYLFCKTTLATTIRLINNNLVIRANFAKIADSLEFREYVLSDLMTIFRVKSRSDSMYPFRKSLKAQLYYPKIVFFLESIEEATAYLKYYHDTFDFEMIPKELQKYRHTGINYLMKAATHSIPDTLHFLKGEHLLSAVNERLDEISKVLRQWTIHGPTIKLNSSIRNASDCGLSPMKLIDDSLKI